WVVTLGHGVDATAGRPVPTGTRAPRRRIGCSHGRPEAGTTSPRGRGSTTDRAEKSRAEYVEIRRSSVVRAQREQVWARVVTAEGVSDEFRPLLSMRFPASLQTSRAGDEPGIADLPLGRFVGRAWILLGGDRKSTRLNSSHVSISYAVFCLKKKNTYKANTNRSVSR